MKRTVLRRHERHPATKRLEPVAMALVSVLGIKDEPPLTQLTCPGFNPTATNAERIAHWLAAHGHDWPCEVTASQLPQRVAELLDLLEAAETTATAKEIHHDH